MLKSYTFHLARERVVDHHWTGKVELDITTLIGGDFAAAAVAITYGALLGKTTPVQMLFIVIFEIIFYSFNETIAVTQYGADAGAHLCGSAALRRLRVLLTDWCYCCVCDFNLDIMLSTLAAP